MEVTLRKGAALSQALLEQARKLPLTKLVTLSIYQHDSAQDTISAATKRLEENIGAAARLNVAAYSLRALIGNANAQSGINGLLTEKAALDATEKLISGVIGGKNVDYEYEQGTDAEIAAAQLESLKARQAGDRYAGDTLQAKVLTAELVKSLEDQLATIRRRKVEIADELLSKNMTTKVTVPAEVKALLDQYQLV